MSNKKIHLVIITNPFQPRKSRIIKHIKYSEKSIFNYMKSVFPSIDLDDHFYVSINGKLLKEKDGTRTYIPERGDWIVCCKSPGNFDTDPELSTLLTVIYVGAIVASIAVGNYPLAAGLIISGSVVLLSNFLSKGLTEDEAEDEPSPTYSWDSRGNPSESGRPWPVLYGTVKVKPYLISKYVETLDHQKQQLNLLFAVADHEVDSIENVKIADNSVDYYPDIVVTKRLGTNDQTVIPSFQNTYVDQYVGVDIPEDTTWIEQQIPGSETEIIKVFVLFPKGLYRLNDSNKVKSTHVVFNVEYRLVGAGSWTNMGNMACYAGRRYALRFWRKKSGLAPGSYEIRIRFRETPNSSDRYVNEAQLEYVQAGVSDDFTYPGTALLAIEAISSDMLKGGIPEVTCEVTRSTVAVHSGSGWVEKLATNPAWVSYDIHVNNVYGGGVPYTRMIYADFLAWANWCDANSFECNMYFDTFMSLPKALEHIGVTGRGLAVQRGSDFSCIVDKSDTPVQLFGIGNIIEGSFTQTFIEKETRANVIEITYYDEDQDYEKQILELRSDELDTDTTIIIKRQKVTLYACTNKDLVVRHAKFMLNCNEYITRSIIFDVGVDALSSVPGDVINVSHDIPQWGYSGRVISATSNTIVLDREVTLSPGNSYHVLVRHSDDDSLEEVAIVGVGAETTTDTLTLITGWLQIPVAEDVYAFGRVDVLVKQFRIFSISRSQEMHRRIEALEYRSEIYDDTAIIPDYPPASDLPYVSDLHAEELWYLSQYTYISLTWHGFGSHSVFKKSEYDTAFVYLGDSNGINSFDVIEGLEAGVEYTFAVSATGNPNDGETVTIRYLGTPSDVPTSINYGYGIYGLEIEEQGNDTVWRGRELKLVWNICIILPPDEAGEEVEGAGSFEPDNSLYDGMYRIYICNADGTLRRQIIQSSNRFVYTYGMNNDDGISPNLIIKVWAVDLNGNVSSLPALLAVSNLAPAAVSGLSAEQYMEGVKFSWLPNSEIDFHHYEYRYKVETDSWSAWTNYTAEQLFLFLSEAQISDHGSEATIYLEIKAVDTFTLESNVVSSNAQCLGLNIEATDITDFAVTASKIFTKIPILEGDSWTDNSPSSGYISWNSHSIYYNGVKYTIAAGNTNLAYVFWLHGDTSYSKAADVPPLTDHDFVIATNSNGGYDLAWNALANAVIGSAFIKDAAIVTAKIADLAVSNAKISNLDGGKITANSITAGKITILNLSDLPSDPPTASGLWINSERIGYWLGGIGWRSYIKNDGEVYFGDGSNEYFKYSTSAGVILSSSKVDAITIKQGGNIKVEGAASNPGSIVFSGTYDVEMYMDTVSDNFIIFPNYRTVDFSLGSNTLDLAFEKIFMYTKTSSHEAALIINCSFPYIDLYLEPASTPVGWIRLLGGVSNTYIELKADYISSLIPNGFRVSANVQGDWCCKFDNDGNTQNSYGIRMVCGATNGFSTGIVSFLQGLDGDETVCGEVRNSSGTFSIYDVSDKRIKRNIVDFKTNALDLINRLKIRRFTKVGAPKIKHVGLVAQEVIDIIPECVTQMDKEFNPSKFGIKRVSKEKAEELRNEGPALGLSREVLVPYLIKAVQELTAEVSILKQIKGGS